MPVSAFRYEQLDVIAKVATHLASAGDLRPALSQVLEWLAQDCAMERGVITLLSEDQTQVQAAITVNEIPAAILEKMRYRAGEGITGRVFETGTSIYLPQLAAEHDFLDRSGLRHQLDRQRLAFFCVPIRYHTTIVGTLSIDKDNRQIADAVSDLAFLEKIALLLAPFVQRQRLEERLELFQHARRPTGAFAKLVGKSAAIEEVQYLIVKVAAATTNVLITGETGTGKGIVAELIHELGPRHAHPLVSVNCGAIPENLIESELFGHEKGAFTGAIQRRIGVIERANAGTVFLDEIGELPLSAQTRLLRVLQTRQFERVGSSKTLQATARFIAATNRDPAESVENGSLRADLYYRLNVFPIRMPPLRERGKADVIMLVDHFVQYYARELEKTIFRIDTPAIDMLTAYHWPGNVRELENVIERAVLLADNGVIHGRHLPPSLQMNRYAPVHENVGDFTQRVQNYEIELLTEALKDCNGNQSKAAELLGITNRIIQYKIRCYGIDYRRFR